MRIDAHYAAAQIGRGRAYQEMGHYGAAIADYSAVLAIDPKDVYALHNRAAAFVRTGDFDSAIADYSQALRIDA